MRSVLSRKTHHFSIHVFYLYMYVQLKFHAQLKININLYHIEILITFMFASMCFSITAWVGSLAYGLSMTFGPVTSMLVRRYGYSRVMTAGCTICAFSILISSFATSIIQLFAMFSVLYGIGTCMAIGPTMTIAPLFFDKHLFIATGITVSGSSFGTLIMGPLSQVIIDRWGWRTAFRVYAAMHVITIIMNSRIRQPKNQSLMLKRKSSFLYDLKIWKNRVFLVWTFSITLVMFGFYIPYVHLVRFNKAK